VVAVDLVGLFVLAFALALGAAAFASGVAPCAVAVEAGAPTPAIASEEFSVEVNCGGVTAKTAPSPPTVPVAINNARFISVPSRTYL
jgi:hypothetical protein